MKKDSILSKLFIECKNREHLNHHKTYWRTRGIANTGTIPIVVHKKNFDPEPIVTLGLNDFVMLLKIIEEHGLTKFV